MAIGDNFVDTSTIMGFKAPDVSALNPATIAANALALRNARLQQQTNALALSSARQQAADKDLLLEAQNQPDSVNYLRGIGRLDLANQFAEAQRKESDAQIESKTKQLNYQNAVAAADKQKTDTALQNVRDMFLGVMQRHPDLNTQEALNDYLNISRTAHNDPNLGPILSATGAHHAATVLQGQTALEEGNLPDLIRNSAFSADEIRKNISSGLYEPKPVEMDLGGTKQFVDMNPRSPTYKQPIGKEYVKTPTPGQQMTFNLGTERLNLAERRENRLSSSTSKGLSQDDLTLLNDAINTPGGLDPNKINSRTASVYAGILRQRRDSGQSFNLSQIHQDVEASGKAFNNFSSGKRSLVVTALNTGMNHLDTLSELGTALNNNDMRAFNSIANEFSRQTGKAAPTNFNLAAQFVGTEIINAMANMGAGTGEERKALKSNFDSASSPAAIQGAIDTARRLISGRIEAIGTEWVATTKRPEEEFISHLSPAARNMYARTGKATTPPPHAGAGTNTTKSGVKYTVRENQ